MRSVDRLALGILGPLWALVLLLSVLSIGRNAVEAPMRVHGAARPDAFPTVVSVMPFAVRAPDPAAGLRVGDRLVRVGEVDLRGASASRTVSEVWAAMAGTNAVALTLERDGRLREVTARIPTSIRKWPVLVVSLVFGAIGVFGLWRFPRLRVAQLAFPSLMATALFFGSRFGATPKELLLAFWIQVAALLFLQPVTVRLIRHFPDGRPGASWARGWPWLLALNGVLLADSVLFATLPAPVLDYGNKLFTAAAPLVFLAVGADRYRHADRVGRRRFKWLLLGTLVASVPGIAIAIASAFEPALGRFYLPSQIAQVAIPIGLWIAIVRHQLFDIDRLLNVAVVVAAIALLWIGAAAGLGPPVWDALAARAGLSRTTATLVLATLVLALSVPAGTWLRRRLDAWTLRERRERDLAVRRLRADLARADKLQEIGEGLTRGIARIWNARGAALFLEVDGAPSPVFRLGALPEDVLREADGSLVVRLEGALPGAVVLGPRRSGEPFDERDRAQLALVAERVASALTALEQRELLASARARNRALREEKTRAERDAARKGELLATASHDLRQPLQALRLFLGTLERRVGDPESRSLAAKAQLSAIAMQQRFEALLDGTRLDAGQVRVDPQGVALHDVFVELEAFLGPLSEEKGLDLAFDARDLRVRSDPSLLRSVLQNLLGNAIRYTDAGRVAVEAERDGDDVLVAVRDTGRGMSEDERARLFDAGARGASAAGELHGSGLGLAIVSRLCALLGHALEVTSEVGRGTCVTLRIAAAREAAPATHRIATAGDVLDGTQIVVVEDDAETREALVALLRGWGVRVLAGDGAQTVLAAAPADLEPDAALLDYTLAQGTGLEALDALERAFGPIPAVILTGESDDAIAARVRARGLPLLRKPAMPVQVRAVLQGLVAGR